MGDAGRGFACTGVDADTGVRTFGWSFSPVTGVPASGELFVGRELGRLSPNAGEAPEDGTMGVGAGSGFDSIRGDCWGVDEAKGDGDGDMDLSLSALYFSGVLPVSLVVMGLPKSVGIDEPGLSLLFPNSEGGDLEGFRWSGSEGRAAVVIAGEVFLDPFDTRSG